VLQKPWLVCRLAALLILRSVGIFSVILLFVCCLLCRLLGLQLTAYSRYVLAGILHNCGGLALQFGALKKIAPSKTLLRFPSYNGIRFAFCNMFS
jgi:hypothetical protein